MNWIEQVTILDLLVKGLIVGVVVSAPLGPVGVLCIQRTLNKGRWYGFVTGLGAALSDIGYALITGYGMSFMDDFLAKNQVLLQIIGSIMLFFFGIYTFRSNPVQSIRPVSSTPGSYLHNFVTAFFVTLSNPLIIFLFIGLFARFSFVMPGSPIGFQLVGYLAIVLGALLWWFGITYFVNKVRTRFNLRGIWILNRVIGIVVMLISVAGFIYTILGKRCTDKETYLVYHTLVFNFLIINFNLKSMFVSKQLKEKNIAEYLIYMWQIEDLIRANGCDMEKIKSTIIAPYPLTEEQKAELTQWYMDLIEMMRHEGIMEKGHLQINKNIITWLTDLHLQLLRSPKFPYYNSAYYKVLPYIVELRAKGADKEEPELETCFEALYGILLLKLQKKEISEETRKAQEAISTLLAMLSNYYIEDKKENWNSNK